MQRHYRFKGRGKKDTATEPAPKKPFLCKMGLHRSDRDYGIRWSDKAVLSHCKRCQKTLTHPFMSWHGGGNY